MKKLLLVLTCVVLLLGVTLQTSNAAFLSNTDVPIATLLTAFPTNVLFYASEFDFSPFSPTKDGILNTGVWSNGAGQYIYFYAIHVYADSSDDVSGLTIDIGNHLVPYDFGAGLTTSFRDQVFFSDPTAYPFLADYTSGVISWLFFPKLLPGADSWEFGFVADAPPYLITVNMLDSGGEGFAVTSSPVPEPGTMMLLGSGLIGLAGWGRKKFRK